MSAYLLVMKSSSVSLVTVSVEETGVRFVVTKAKVTQLVLKMLISVNLFAQLLVVNFYMVAEALVSLHMWLALIL